MANYRTKSSDEIRIAQDSASGDKAWDSFLLSTPAGQFQQSCAWARIKEHEGWKSSRWILTHGQSGAILGGFQILWKHKGPFRIGYLNKGPVAGSIEGQDWPRLLQAVKSAARSLRLAALIIQAPDLARGSEDALAAMGAVVVPGPTVITATLLLDLNPGLAHIEKGISQRVFRQIRKTRAGATFRWADATSAESFFTLMQETCRRQKVAPSPSSAAAIATVLREFSVSSEGESRIHAGILEAVEGGRVTAATLLLRFGDRLTEWKKGWTGETSGTHPNKALVHEAISHGCSTGCTLYDFFGISRSTAERAVAGGEADLAGIPGSDEFKLRFGGTPTLLPKARIWSPFPPLRPAIRLWVKYRDRQLKAAAVPTPSGVHG